MWTILAIIRIFALPFCEGILPNVSSVDECHNCHSSLAICTNVTGSFTCQCKPGYQGNGLSCSDVDECTASTDDCHSALATCTNTAGSFTCRCNPGYQGNGVTCSDVNECTVGTDNCHSSFATCTNTAGSYTCQCKPGYQGNGVTCSAPKPSKIHFYYESPRTPSVYRVVQGSLTGIQKAFDDHNHNTITKDEEFTVVVDFSSPLYNQERQWYEIPARFCYGKIIVGCLQQKQRPFRIPYLVRPSSVETPVPFVVPFSKLHNATSSDGKTVFVAGTVYDQFKTFQVNGAKYDTSTGILERFSAESPEKAGKISGIDFVRDTGKILKHQPLAECHFVEWASDGCVPGLDNVMAGYDVKFMELKSRRWLKVKKFPSRRDNSYLHPFNMPGIGEKNYLVFKDMALEKASPVANPFSYLFTSVEEQVNTTLKTVGLRFTARFLLGSGKYGSISRHYKKQSYSAAMSGTEFRFFRAAMSISYLEDEGNWDDSFKSKWKSLYDQRNKKKAMDFFRDYGTHYVVRAVMGGRQETVFTVDYCEVSKDKKTLRDFEAKIVKPYTMYSSTGLGIQAYYRYIRSHSNSLSKMIISGPQTTCIGGNALDLDLCYNLTLWRSSVLNNPYPITMTLKPFYTLVMDDQKRLWMKQMYEEYLIADLDELKIGNDIKLKAKCDVRASGVKTSFPWWAILLVVSKSVIGLDG